MVGNQAIDLTGYGYWKVGVSTDTLSNSAEWKPPRVVSFGGHPVKLKSQYRPRLAGRAWLRPSKRRGK